MHTSALGVTPLPGPRKMYHCSHLLFGEHLTENRSKVALAQSDVMFYTLLSHMVNRQGGFS